MDDASRLKDLYGPETLVAVRPGFTVAIPKNWKDKVDPAAQALRQINQLDKLCTKEASLTAKLANDQFVSRAPAGVVQAARDQLANTTKDIEVLIGLMSVPLPSPSLTQKVAEIAGHAYFQVLDSSPRIAEEFRQGLEKLGMSIVESEGYRFIEFDEV